MPRFTPSVSRLEPRLCLSAILEPSPDVYAPAPPVPMDLGAPPGDLTGPTDPAPPSQFEIDLGQAIWNGAVAQTLADLGLGFLND